MHGVKTSEKQDRFQSRVGQTDSRTDVQTTCNWRVLLRKSSPTLQTCKSERHSAVSFKTLDMDLCVYLYVCNDHLFKLKI